MSDQEEHSQEQKPYLPVCDEITEEKPEKDDNKNNRRSRQDPLGSITWALILIWAGLVFLAVNLGWLDQFRQIIKIPGKVELLSLDTWTVVFLGAGLILLLEALIRTFAPAYRDSTGGNYFMAVIFLGLGLSGILGRQLIWPLVLIGLGLGALANAFFWQRR